MNFETREELPSTTGAILALRHEPAIGRAQAAVLVCHGLAEHSARYRRFAEFLAGRGFHVYAHDHRGHGYTHADGADPGRFAPRDGGRLVVEDVIAVRDHVARRHPGLPILLFGHSMGGLIALSTVEAQPLRFDGLAVWNSNADPGLAGALGLAIVKAERFLKGSDVPSVFGPRFTFDAWAKSVPNARTPFDWLSRDPAEVDAYVADPLCGFQASVSLWIDLLVMATTVGGPKALERLRKDLPIHLVGGGQDPATDRGRAVQALANRMKHLGMTRVSLEIHADMRHETLNEIGNGDAMKAFAAWAEAAARR